MTNRNKRVKVYNPQKREKKALPKKDKPSKALRNVFVFLQSLLGSFIVLCFFIYSTSSTVKIYNHGNVEENNISFYDLSNDYYKSDVFKNNFRNYVESMIRYVTISEQITRNGKYDPNIIIDVGEFAHRNSAGEYNGPEIKYKLAYAFNGLFDFVFKFGGGNGIKSAFGSYKKSAAVFFFVDYHFTNLFLLL